MYFLAIIRTIYVVGVSFCHQVLHKHYNIISLSVYYFRSVLENARDLNPLTSSYTRQRLRQQFKSETTCKCSTVFLCIIIILTIQYYYSVAVLIFPRKCFELDGNINLRDGRVTRCSREAKILLKLSSPFPLRPILVLFLRRLQLLVSFSLTVSTHPSTTIITPLQLPATFHLHFFSLSLSLYLSLHPSLYYDIYHYHY